ncbi:MAG: hypothetical protein MUF49_31875, partial [Oculatellaceae cyanobacterium Prado106]|nr:hypothetical protein [Oculatellaceae cyanobacterium Prado106]
FLVSVDVDPIENERCCTANSRIGRYKDLQTGSFVRFVSFAVPISPTIVLDSPIANLVCLFEQLLLEEVNSPSFVVPAGFDYLSLYQDLKEGLAAS